MRDGRYIFYYLCYDFVETFSLLGPSLFSRIMALFEQLMFTACPAACSPFRYMAGSGGLFSCLLRCLLSCLLCCLLARRTLLRCAGTKDGSGSWDWRSKIWRFGCSTEYNQNANFLTQRFCSKFYAALESAEVLIINRQ